MPRKILFVCTGNTCRSAMAQVLFQNLVNKDMSLRSAGVEVASAATLAAGAPATLKAVQLMREHGLDLSQHKSKLLVNRLVDWADLILVMKASQKQIVISRYPAAAKKAYVLSEYVGERGEVPDPVGCGIGAYENCVAVLVRLLHRLAERLMKEC